MTDQADGEAAASWIDSHCHVYDDGVPGGVDEAVEAATAAGVDTLISVGCDRATSLAGLEIAARFPCVHPTVGLHPHEARHGVSAVADLFDRTEVVAVGECGLDYYYDHSPRDDQRAAFAEQIGIANDLGLPLVVHTRDAWDDTFDLLDAEAMPERTIIHCFTGGVTELNRCLDRGAFVSFSGIVTFPKAVELHAAARACPLDRLLVETDSPYLSPVPRRGRPNTPANVAHVGRGIAELRGVPEGAIRESTRAATLRAFPKLAAVASE